MSPLFYWDVICSKHPNFKPALKACWGILVSGAAIAAVIASCQNRAIETRHWNALNLGRAELLVNVENQGLVSLIVTNFDKEGRAMWALWGGSGKHFKTIEEVNEKMQQNKILRENYFAAEQIRFVGTCKNAGRTEITELVTSLLPAPDQGKVFEKLGVWEYASSTNASTLGPDQTIWLYCHWYRYFNAEPPADGLKFLFKASYKTIDGVAKTNELRSSWMPGLGFTAW